MIAKIATGEIDEKLKNPSVDFGGFTATAYSIPFCLSRRLKLSTCTTRSDRYGCLRTMSQNAGRGDDGILLLNGEGEGEAVVSRMTEVASARKRVKRVTGTAYGIPNYARRRLLLSRSVGRMRSRRQLPQSLFASLIPVSSTPHAQPGPTDSDACGRCRRNAGRWALRGQLTESLIAPGADCPLVVSPAGQAVDLLPSFVFRAFSPGRDESAPPPAGFAP